jgi:hypothetical protein
VKHLFKFNTVESAITLLLFGSLLLGVSYISVLPIWEGFDETAHFSYIQQVADSKKLPLGGKDRISKDVEKYYAYAPVPYTIWADLQDNDKLSYQSFFSKPVEFLLRSKEFIHSTLDSPRKYLPGRGTNWESQHPPLFYILLSPVYLITSELSWGKQIFILRIVSYTFAWLGLVIAVFTCLDVAKNQSSQNKTSQWHWATIGAGLWPFFFPAWFSGMARIGNDSFCCLLLSLTWFVSIKMTGKGVSLKYFLLLGLLLSLGCLTKVIFIPISIAVLSFLLLRECKLRGRNGFLKTIWLCSFVIAAILTSSGWWYWNNYEQYGVITGNIDLKFIKQAGGLWNGLESNFSFFQWARSHAALLVTVGWIGSWSLVKPPLITLFPIALILLLMMYAYIRSIQHSKLTSEKWLIIWLLLPILTILSYHVLIRIALTGEGRGTPGFYLHILAGPISAALGLSLYEVWGKDLFRRLIQVLFCYIILFTISINWAQALFFSGIVSASESEITYLFPEQLPPFLGLVEAYQNLQIIAYPNISLLCLILGWSITLTGLVFTKQYFNESIQSLLSTTKLSSKN